jgi:hypothetical protein
VDDSQVTTSPCCPSPKDGQVSRPCCCGVVVAERAPASRWTEAPWIQGVVGTAVGNIPRVSTALRFSDRLGSWKARWAIGRMWYLVEPGLYAVGSPTPDSPVFVSANYKMSFDRLRSQLGGRHVWILVLDTRGINVWCAAGGGTFSTDEIVRRAEAVRLGEVVSHRALVVPQLAATGVNAHEVRRRNGFRVVYGPVRAEDLPEFMDAGMKATREMRRVRFPLRDRAVLIPVELVMSFKYAIFLAVCFLLLSGLNPGGYSLSLVLTSGVKSAMLLLAAYLAGVTLPPILLPWLPGRSFSAKGAWVGLALALTVGAYALVHPTLLQNLPTAVAWFLIIPALTSFLAMNFTGASTYTSLSGVRREMRVAVPIQIAFAAAGMVLWLVGRFV